MTAARRNARGEDVMKIKDIVVTPRFRQWTPHIVDDQNPQLRGWYHPEMGKFLCPIIYDFSDPACIVVCFSRRGPLILSLRQRAARLAAQGPQTQPAALAAVYVQERDRARQQVPRLPQELNARKGPLLPAPRALLILSRLAASSSMGHGQ